MSDYTELDEDLFRRRLEEVLRFITRNQGRPRSPYIGFTMPYGYNEEGRIDWLSTRAPSSPTRQVRIDSETIKDIHQKLDLLFGEIREVKSYLERRESNKEDAILEFKGKIVEVPEIKYVYCKQTVDGMSFWTLFDSPDPIRTLREIVNIQIELENKYDKIFFEFLIDPISDEEVIETMNWIPLFKRE